MNKADLQLWDLVLVVPHNGDVHEIYTNPVDDSIAVLSIYENGEENLTWVDNIGVLQ